MSATPSVESPLMASIVRMLLGATIAAAAITHLVAGVGPFFWGVIGGGLVQVANLSALIWLGRRLFHAEKRSGVFYVALFMLKIALLIGVVLYVLKALPVDVIGFMVGVALLMPAALVASALAPVETPAGAVEVEG